MFLILIMIFVLRMMFWLAVVLLAIVLAIVAGTIALIGAAIGTQSPEKGAEWKETAQGVWSVVMSAANTADNHGRWVLPNKKPTPRPSAPEPTSDSVVLPISGKTVYRP